MRANSSRFAGYYSPLDFGRLGRLMGFGSSEIGTIAEAITSPNYDLGLQAFQAYYSAASAYPQNFPYTSASTMLQGMAANSWSPPGAFFTDYTISGVGDVIKQNNIPMSAAQSAMKQLADRGQGKFPADPAVFQTMMVPLAVDANSGFLDGVAFVASGTAAEIASGVSTGLQSVGDLAIGGLQIFRSPWLLGGAIALAGGLWLVASGNLAKFRRNLKEGLK